MTNDARRCVRAGFVIVVVIGRLSAPPGGKRLKSRLRQRLRPRQRRAAAPPWPRKQSGLPASPGLRRTRRRTRRPPQPCREGGHGNPFHFTCLLHPMSSTYLAQINAKRGLESSGPGSGVWVRFGSRSSAYELLRAFWDPSTRSAGWAADAQRTSAAHRTGCPQRLGNIKYYKTIAYGDLSP